MLNKSSQHRHQLNLTKLQYSKPKLPLVEHQKSAGDAFPACKGLTVHLQKDAHLTAIDKPLLPLCLVYILKTVR